MPLLNAAGAFGPLGMAPLGGNFGGAMGNNGFAKLWAASGVAFGPLLDSLITLARERHAARQALRTTPL